MALLGLSQVQHTVLGSLMVHHNSMLDFWLAGPRMQSSKLQVSSSSSTTPLVAAVQQPYLQ
jgi:hypothetical protein